MNSEKDDYASVSLSTIPILYLARIFHKKGGKTSYNVI